MNHEASIRSVSFSTNKHETLMSSVLAIWLTSLVAQIQEVIPTGGAMTDNKNITKDGVHHHNKMFILRLIQILQTQLGTNFWRAKLQTKLPTALMYQPTPNWTRKTKFRDRRRNQFYFRCTNN